MEQPHPSMSRGIRCSQPSCHILLDSTYDRELLQSPKLFEFFPHDCFQRSSISCSGSLTATEFISKCSYRCTCAYISGSLDPCIRTLLVYAVINEYISNFRKKPNTLDSYPIGSGGSFPGDKTAVACSCPLTSS
jgi:hypothetical protein